MPAASATAEAASCIAAGSFGANTNPSSSASRSSATRATYPAQRPASERAFDPSERAEYARDAHPKRLTCATRPRAQNAAWCVELRTELTVELTVREPIRGLRRASMACESCANR
jgi:hypothetical protein